MLLNQGRIYSWITESLLIGNILPWLRNNALTTTSKESPDEVKVLELPWYCWKRGKVLTEVALLHGSIIKEWRTHWMTMFTRRTRRTGLSLTHNVLVKRSQHHWEAPKWLSSAGQDWRWGWCYRTGISIDNWDGRILEQRRPCSSTSDSSLM